MLALFFLSPDKATTQLYTLSLHDALPIFPDDLGLLPGDGEHFVAHGADVQLLADHRRGGRRAAVRRHQDRKSTRLNSSHRTISYAVFCLKKKKKESS